MLHIAKEIWQAKRERENKSIPLRKPGFFLFVSMYFLKRKTVIITSS